MFVRCGDRILDKARRHRAKALKKGKGLMGYRKHVHADSQSCSTAEPFEVKQSARKKECAFVHHDILIAKGREKIQDQNGEFACRRPSNEPCHFGANEGALYIDPIHDFLASVRSAGNDRGIVLPSAVQNDQRGMLHEIRHGDEQMFGILDRHNMQSPGSGMQVQ